MKRLLARIALVGGITLVMLAVVELVLQATPLGAPVHASPYRTGGAIHTDSLTLPDRDLLYRLVPDSRFLDYYRVNAHGWRGPQVAAEKPTDVVRIAAVGDSCTIGLGVREDETWPFQLQRLLNELFDGAARFEVLNTGVSGYSTWQNRIQVERDILPLDVDVVVALPIGANDGAPTIDDTDREASEFNASLRGFLDRTRLARLLRAARGGSHDATPDSEGWPPTGATTRRRVPEDEFRANLQAMDALARESDATFVLVAPPHSEVARTIDPKLLEAAAAVEQVAVEGGIPLADPRPAFGAYEPYVLFIDPIHPGPAGQRLIALAVLEALAASDVALPGGPRLQFVRSWLAARRDGLAAVEPALLRTDGPPLWAELRGAYAEDGEPRRDDLLITQHDPLIGSSTTTHPLGRMLLEGDATATVRTAIEEHVVARDLFARLLFGPGPTGGAPTSPPSPDTLALARALVVFDRAVGATELGVDRRIGAAVARAREGDLDDALSLLDAVLELDPRSAEALNERGQLLRKHGRAADALRDFQSAIEVDPGSHLAHTLIGSMNLRQGRLAQAEASLRTALDIQPGNALARYLLGRTLYDLQRWDDAAFYLSTSEPFGQRYTDVDDLLADIEKRRSAVTPADPP